MPAVFQPFLALVRFSVSGDQILTWRSAQPLSSKWKLGMEIPRATGSGDREGKCHILSALTSLRKAKLPNHGLREHEISTKRRLGAKAAFKQYNCFFGS